LALPQGALLLVQAGVSGQKLTDSTHPYSHFATLHGCNGVEVGVGEAHFDKTPDFDKLHALVLSSGTGILLRPKDRDGCFVRVGVIGLSDKRRSTCDDRVGGGGFKKLFEAGSIDEIETATAAYIPWVEVTLF
jgi:hypothetical protein